MTDVPYTHGHDESVLRSHRWRTAENSAAYLLPRLQPSMSLLDVGCGPGTITRDLAARVAPGRVVGIDAAESVIAEATAAATGPATGPATPSVTFEVGDVYALAFDDATFDIVHAHQLLQHLGDPVAALTEMRRVCRPGGLVAARDADYPTFRFFPDQPDIARAIEAYGTLTRVNGANWDAGRRLLHWARSAGFAAIAPSASVWCFATPDERNWWGELWAERFTHSWLAEQLVGHGIVSQPDLAVFARAWRAWAASPDGWFAVIHGEILATV
jgi:SAM-dependent methyltransferase